MHRLDASSLPCGRRSAGHCGAVMQDKINAAFARGELTPAQAADETMARREPTVGQAVLGAVIYVLALVLLGLALAWGPKK